MTPLPAAIVALVDSAAARHGVEPEIARAVAWVESRGNPSVTSSAGAMGVFQLMPATAEGLGVTDPFDAAQNVDAGVRFLAQLRERFKLWKPALAAYNWGPGRVQSGRPWPEQVQTYVEKVLSRAAAELGGTDAAASKEPGLAELPFAPWALQYLGRPPHCPSCSCCHVAEGKS